MMQLQYVDDVYRTATQPVSWLARTFPSLSFHTRFIRIGLRCCAMAKRGRYGDQEWSDSSLEVLRALERVGVQVEISGIHHLDEIDSPCLIVGNHMSTLETAILPGIIQPHRHVTFVVKQSLLTYPYFKHVMKSRDPVAVTQTDPRQDFKTMLEGGQERLEKGVSIVIFPEGRRAAKFDPANFNTIGIKLARRADVPIIPLAMKTDAWGIGKIFPDFGPIDPSKKVHFAFGEPIHVEGRGNGENEQIIEFISRHLESWKAEDLIVAQS